MRPPVVNRLNLTQNALAHDVLRRAVIVETNMNRTGIPFVMTVPNGRPSMLIPALQRVSCEQNCAAGAPLKE